MSEYKLSEIAKQMIETAKRIGFDNVNYAPFEKHLSRGLRLRCYVIAGKLFLDMERQFRDLEQKETWICRGAFGVPYSAWTKPIAGGDGWHGVRVAWSDAPKVEEKNEVEQRKLFD